MKYLKTYETISNGTPNVGNGIGGSRWGLMLKLKEYKNIPFVLDVFKKKNIKYELYFNDKRIIILFTRLSDIKKLYMKGYQDGDNYSDYYISDNTNWGAVVKQIFKDHIDELPGLLKATIRNDKDLIELMAQFNMYSDSNKFNL